MRETTLLLALDGCRRDYLTPEDTPFLHALAARGVSGSLAAPAGYSHRAVLLTGAYPDKTEAFGAYAYDSERSPFRWTARLGPLKHLYGAGKNALPLRVMTKHVGRWASGDAKTDPAWIPGPYLPHFTPSDDHHRMLSEGTPRIPRILDLLREKNRSFRHVARTRGDEGTHQALIETFRSRENHALVIAQLSLLEEGGRTHGPLVPPNFTPAAGQTADDQTEMRRLLRDLDRRCAELHRALTENYDAAHFLLAGTHGMAPVMQKVDLRALVEKTGLKPGRDVVLFLDSTLARFWFRNDRARREVEEALAHVPYGRLVSIDERRERRLPTDPRHGEALFAADPGVLFWPDYFHPVEDELKGMHGYLDKKLAGPDTWGAETAGLLILDSPRIDAPRALGLRPLVDVLPTLCDLTDLAAPATNEGRSLLEARGEATA